MSMIRKENIALMKIKAILVAGTVGGSMLARRRALQLS
jgi:hypothetical protein